MDTVRIYSDIISPISSSEDSNPTLAPQSPISSRKSSQDGGLSQGTSFTAYDRHYSESVDRLTYYLNLLRPQSPNSNAKTLDRSREEEARSRTSSVSSDLSVQRCPSIYSTPRVPENMRIDPLDSNYLQFFFIQAPMFLLFTQHFPTATGAVYELASRHKPTLESILAVAAQHADMVAGRNPTRALVHLSKCLPEIQSALSNVQINEGHITAVYCLTRLYFARRERIAARNHLHGLFLMLEAYQQGPLDGVPISPTFQISPNGRTNGTKSTRPPSPLMMFLWRIAIQMDLALGNRGQDLVFPSPAPNQDRFHRTWISRIASPEATEWALAEFALDDLHHHTLSLEKQAYKIRNGNHYIPAVDEPRIAKEIDKLWRMHHDWKARAIIRHAAQQEIQWRSSHPATPEDYLKFQFLRYGPPLRFQNEFFVRMLLYHTERIIEIDIILQPRLTDRSPRRVRAAIEVCRIIAGVEDMAHGQGGIGQYFQGLNNAAIVFNPQQYAAEFQWVLEKLLEVDRLSGYDSGRVLVDILRESWASPDPWEMYRRLSGRSAPS